MPSKNLPTVALLAGVFAPMSVDPQQGSARGLVPSMDFPPVALLAGVFAPSSFDPRQGSARGLVPSVGIPPVVGFAPASRLRIATDKMMKRKTALCQRAEEKHGLLRL